MGRQSWRGSVTRCPPRHALRQERGFTFEALSFSGSTELINKRPSRRVSACTVDQECARGRGAVGGAICSNPAVGSSQFGGALINLAWQYCVSFCRIVTHETTLPLSGQEIPSQSPPGTAAAVPGGLEVTYCAGSSAPSTEMVPCLRTTMGSTGNAASKSRSSRCRAPAISCCTTSSTSSILIRDTLQARFTIRIKPFVAPVVQHVSYAKRHQCECCCMLPRHSGSAQVGSSWIWRGSAFISHRLRLGCSPCRGRLG